MALRFYVCSFYAYKINHINKGNPRTCTMIFIPGGDWNWGYFDGNKWINQGSETSGEKIGFFREEWKKLEKVFLPVSSGRNWENWKKVNETGRNRYVINGAFKKVLERSSQILYWNISADLILYFSKVWNFARFHLLVFQWLHALRPH